MNNRRMEEKNRLAIRAISAELRSGEWASGLCSNLVDEINKTNGTPAQVARAIEDWLSKTRESVVDAIRSATQNNSFSRELQHIMGGVVKT